MASPVLFPRKPTLVGERVLLRPFTPADIDAMGPVLADPEVLRLTGSAHSTAEVEATRLVVAHAFAATDLHRTSWRSTPATRGPSTSTSVPGSASRAGAMTPSSSTASGSTPS